MSRTVVKHASKVCLAARLDLSNVRDGVSRAIALTTSGSPPRQRWTWQSMSTGKRVKPRPSMRVAPRGMATSLLGPAAAMVAPRMTTVARSSTAPAPLIRRVLWIAMVTRLLADGEGDHDAAHDVVQFEIATGAVGMAVVAFDAGVRHGSVGEDGLKVLRAASCDESVVRAVRIFLHRREALPLEIAVGAVPDIDRGQTS